TYLWQYDLSTSALTPLLELDRAAASAHALAADPLNSNVAASNQPGFWEFSGVIDASAWLGADSWFVDVQAHSLRIHPSATTVEGGQVLSIVTSRATPTIGQLRLHGQLLSGGRVRLGWTASNRSSLSGFQVERSGGDGGWETLTPEMLDAAADHYDDTP